MISGYRNACVVISANTVENAFRVAFACFSGLNGNKEQLVRNIVAREVKSNKVNFVFIAFIFL